jgi:hypothetical protein
MREIFYIVVGTGGHLGGDHAIEAYYTVDGDTVTLTDEDGKPIRDSFGNAIKDTAQGTNQLVIASRLALRHWRAARDWKDDFNRPLSGRDYPHQGWR